MVALGGQDGVLRIVDLSQKSIDSHKERTEGIGPNRKRVKTDHAEFHSAKTEYEISSGNIRAIKWSDNLNIFVGGDEHAIRNFDIELGRVTNTIFTNNKTIIALDTTPEGLVITSHEDGDVRVWDPKASKLVTRIPGHNSYWVSQISMSPASSQIFATCGYDGGVSVWDLRCEKPLYHLKTTSDKLFGLAWNGAGQIISGGDAGEIYMHKITQS